MSELLNAVHQNNLRKVKELIKAGADVNAKDNYGWTALMEASEDGHDDLVELLINAGAELDVQNMHGATALMWASYWGYMETVKLLLKAGANFRIKDNNRKTALDLCIDKEVRSLIIDVMFK